MDKMIKTHNSDLVEKWKKDDTLKNKIPEKVFSTLKKLGVDNLCSKLIMALPEMLEFLYEYNGVCEPSCFHSDGYRGLNAGDVLLSEDPEDSLIKLLRSHRCFRLSIPEGKIWYEDKCFLTLSGIEFLRDRKLTKFNDLSEKNSREQVSMLVYALSFFGDIFPFGDIEFYEVEKTDFYTLTEKLRLYQSNHGDIITLDNNPELWTEEDGLTFIENVAY